MVNPPKYTCRLGQPSNDQTAHLHLHLHLSPSSIKVNEPINHEIPLSLLSLPFAKKSKHYHYTATLLFPSPRFPSPFSPQLQPHPPFTQTHFSQLTSFHSIPAFLIHPVPRILMFSTPPPISTISTISNLQPSSTFNLQTQPQPVLHTARYPSLLHTC
jgi:hypothetical protein